MSFKTVAGSTLRISAAQPATYTVAGYAALVWTAIGEITNLGEFGRDYVQVKHNSIANRATQKKKGSFDEGGFQLDFAVDNLDAGQILLIAAQNSDNDYSVEFTTQNGSKYYMQVQVGGVKYKAGGVDDKWMASCPLDITSGGVNPGFISNLVAS
jgi:hypothetical protein